MTLVARHLTITGRVQGVFYRAWAVDTARELGLAGWVRNRMSGAVEAVVQGEAAKVECFIDAAWKGPPAARVEHIDASASELDETTDFDVRATM
ncbi:MAG: acylphosphatase [Sphingomonadales bacterium]|nr:acylphosphatase [Sphingomonadales bacterium]